MNPMDTLTTLALSVNNPILTEIGTLLGNSYVFAALVLALVFFAERRDGKRLKLLLSLLLCIIIVSLIKGVLMEARPCAGLEWCPWGYSFPSMHAAVAFTLMIGFIDKKSFPLFLLFALFVSFTRLNLGVHVFHDIAGALPMAIVAYYVTDLLWKRYAPKDMEGGR